MSFSFRKLLRTLRNQYSFNMKTKLETTEKNILGSTILAVRKSKGITQEELGAKVGLSKSSVSKIEKGITHISAEDASILIEAMGEELSLAVTGMDNSPQVKTAKATFLMTGVSWFAAQNNITKSKAYQYLLMYKGIDFLERNYRYEQTLTREVILSDLTRICANNGGRL